MTGLIRTAFARIHLNLKALTYLLSGKMLTPERIGNSYDSIAPSYDNNWLCHLTGVTDQLLESIPERRYQSIADLGCGSGYTTVGLAKRFPNARVSAVDVSQRMVEACRSRVGNEAFRYVCSDMLSFLENSRSNEYDLVLSAWAIGYSHPQRIIRQASRVLKSGGIISFVVNYEDTMKPIFKAYRDVMRCCPEKLTCITIPRFPKSLERVETVLRKSGFDVFSRGSGHCLIRRDLGNRKEFSDWVFGTGVLAGFDQMLPLLSDHELRAFFLERIAVHWEPLKHHYLYVTGEKNG